MANPSLLQGPKDIGATGSSTSLSGAYSSNVTSGSLLVCTIGYSSSNDDVGSSGVADSLSQTWTKAVGIASPAGGAVVAGDIFYYKNTAAGACTVTITFGNSVTFREVTLYEFSPGTFSWGSTLDGTNSATGNSTAPASGSITTTNAVDVLIGFSVVSSSCTAGTTSWTFHQTAQNTDGTEYLIQTSTGSQNATFTQSSSGKWVAMIAAIKAVSGSTVTLPSTTMSGTLGIANTPQLKGRLSGGSSVTVSGAFGIANTPQLKGRISGGSSVTMQGLLGIANSPQLKGRLAGGATVTMQGLLGIANNPALKSRLGGGAAVPLQALFGIANNPVLKGRIAGGSSIAAQGVFGIGNNPFLSVGMGSNMQALFGIANSPTLKGKLSGGLTVTIPASFGITSSPILKGKIAGGSSIQIQALLGVANSPVLKGRMAGGSVVIIQGAFGVNGHITALRISQAQIQAHLGIFPPPNFQAGQQGGGTVFYFTDSFGLHRIAPL